MKYAWGEIWEWSCSASNTKEIHWLGRDPTIDNSHITHTLIDTCLVANSQLSKRTWDSHWGLLLSWEAVCIPALGRLTVQKEHSPLYWKAHQTVPETLMKFSLHTWKNSSETVAVGSGTGHEWDNELVCPAIHRLNSCQGMYHVIFKFKNLCLHHSCRTKLLLLKTVNYASPVN